MCTAIHSQPCNSEAHNELQPNHHRHDKTKFWKKQRTCDKCCPGQLGTFPSQSQQTKRAAWSLRSALYSQSSSRLDLKVGFERACYHVMNSAIYIWSATLSQNSANSEATSFTAWSMSLSANLDIHMHELLAEFQALPAPMLRELLELASYTILWPDCRLMQISCKTGTLHLGCGGTPACLGCASSSFCFDND
jgi:hypothetical protein